ncbi:MAG TPA: hypothetical protein PLX59_04230, partial [Candidatus Cloacimonadota bacterium]|nr:hypothetical protein [Candidatus Cloacimonadota bacterium]
HVSISPGGICRIICESTLLSLGPAGQGLPPYDGALLTSATGLIPLVIAQNEGTLLFWMEDEAYTTSLRMQVLDAGGVTQMPYGGLAIASGIRQSCTDADVCPVGDRFLTAWLDNRPELNKRLIYYQIIDEGENILSEGGVPLNPQGSYNEYFQQLLPLGEQAAIIYSIWINGGFRAYLQVIGSDGNKLYNGYGLEIFSDYTVNSGSNCYASYYDGDFYVTWSKFAGEPGNLSAELRAQRISGGSSLWGPSGKLIRQSTPLAGFYATGMQGNYVIWTEHYQTRVLKLDSQGDPYPGWDSAGILALDTSVSQRYYMQASCMESDNLILILGIQQGNTERIVAQKFDPQGQRILAPSGMSVFPDQPVTYLMDVIQSPTSLDLLYCDGSILRLQRLNPDCSIIGSPSGLPIIQYNGYGLEARLIRYNNLNYNVYICYDQSPDDNQKDIYCQEICPEDGSLVGSLVPVCTAPGLQTQMRAASQGLSAVLVWMDERARIMGSSLDTHSVYADFRYTGATSTDDPQIIPPEYVMIQTWPNPFRESLSIKLKSVPSEVEISVFNLRGQRIRSLSDFIRGEDYMIWNWDGKDDSGISCAQGIYFIRAVSKGMDLRKKVLLLN